MYPLGRARMRYHPPRIKDQPEHSCLDSQSKNRDLWIEFVGATDFRQVVKNHRVAKISVVRGHRPTRTDSWNEI